MAQLAKALVTKPDIQTSISRSHRPHAMKWENQLPQVALRPPPHITWHMHVSLSASMRVGMHACTHTHIQKIWLKLLKK